MKGKDMKYADKSSKMHKSMPKGKSMSKEMSYDGRSSKMPKGKDMKYMSGGRVGCESSPYTSAKGATSREK